MANDQVPPAVRADKAPANDTGERPLPPAASRALAEAAARREKRDRKPAGGPKEVNGRGGPDPTRYGDWEVNGLASDF